MGRYIKSMTTRELALSCALLIILSFIAVDQAFTMSERIADAGGLKAYASSVVRGVRTVIEARLAP
jgi:hypothetical protein